MTKQSSYRIIISGGGTGGHVFPALAVADQIKSEVPEAEILFVGAEGRMEMDKVPRAGYEIRGLPVTGFQRSLSLKNLKFPLNLVKSLFRAKKIIKHFQPDVVIGTGGYASGPVVYVASTMNIPCVIQEQNSYAGITNRLLAPNVSRICVAYEGMEKYFPKEKIVITGNPVRQDIINAGMQRLPALYHFKLSAEAKTILVIGGSLGARTINESVAKGLDKIRQAGFQLIWQTGHDYYDIASELCKINPRSNGWGEFKVHQFIERMDMAYAAADMIISRAGAIAVSELCIVQKPVILVPSPNVAEDHQTKNARNLLNHNAAWMVSDQKARENLVDYATKLLNDEKEQEILSKNIAEFARPNATGDICKEVFNLIEN